MERQTEVFNEQGDLMCKTDNAREYMNKVGFPTIAMDGNKVVAYNTKDRHVHGCWMSRVLNEYNMKY